MPNSRLTAFQGVRPERGRDSRHRGGHRRRSRAVLLHGEDKAHAQGLQEVLPAEGGAAQQVPGLAAQVTTISLHACDMCRKFTPKAKGLDAFFFYYLGTALTTASQRLRSSSANSPVDVTCSGATRTPMSTCPATATTSPASETPGSTGENRKSA